MKKWDVTISIIVVVEAKDKAEALDNAIVDIEDNFSSAYVTDTEIVEIKDE